MSDNFKPSEFTNRGGRITTVPPPTPPKKAIVPDNSLLYAKMGTLSVEGVKCEKYQQHAFDGTVATCLVMYRFSQSNHQINSPLCEEHAKELIDYLAEFTPQPPYSNTGVTTLFNREENHK